MRVALNLEQLLQPAPGGVGRYTAKLARLLPGVHDEPGDAIALVPFVARHPRGRVRAALREFDLDGLEPVIAPLPRPLLYDSWHVLGFPALRHLGRPLRDVDVVHAPSVAVPPRGDAPLVVTAHDAAPLLFPETYPRRGRWFHERGLAAAASRADLVITVSYAAAEELVAHTAIEPDRIRVVPNGVDLAVADDDDVARVRRHVRARPAPVPAVGRQSRAAQERRRVGPGVCGVGGDDRPRPPARARRPTGLGRGRGGHARAVAATGRARPQAIGRVDEAVLRGLYRGADLFVFPSRHEGFGLPVLEAMAQGTAVVCADIPALREVAGDAATAPAGSTTSPRGRTRSRSSSPTTARARRDSRRAGLERGARVLVGSGARRRRVAVYQRGPARRIPDTTISFRRDGAPPRPGPGPPRQVAVLALGQRPLRPHLGGPRGPTSSSPCSTVILGLLISVPLGDPRLPAPRALPADPRRHRCPVHDPVARAVHRC